jgi:hypothetical protein
MRTRFFTVTVVLGVLVAAARLTAQGPDVKPGPEHEFLKESAGTWDALVKSEGKESKGSLTCEIGLNGLWLLDHFKSDLSGMKFEGMGATSYDPAKKKYVNVWIDSMSTSPSTSEGTYDKATKTLTLVGSMPMPDGTSMKTTMTTVSKDANTKVFTLRGSVGGKDIEMIEITYKRRPK